jgi:hypothetical protein
MSILDASLRALAHAHADDRPPARVDRAVAQAIADARRQAATHPRRTRRIEPWLAWPLALAASVFALSFVVRQAPPATIAPGVDPRDAAAFLPLAADDDIASASDAYVLAARLPRPSLGQLGLPVNPARIDQPVDAELLVRPDGTVLAFRFVN